MGEIKYIDLFAGIGGFRYGIERCNWGIIETPEDKDRQQQLNTNSSNGYGRRANTFTCVYSNEWDKYAAQIYTKHYGEIDTRDIRTVASSEIPDFDLLVGGFPCQAFSIAGKRKGFDDTRGTLFFEIARILTDKRPRYFILENVRGLLSHDEGKTFQTILGVLTDLGYECEWQVLNSKNFGVPQNRERVFIVGHLRGTPRLKVFPIGNNDKISSKRQGKVSPTITQRYYKQGQSDRYIAVEKPNLDYIGGIIGKRDKWLKDGKDNSRNFSQGQRVYGTEGISSTLAGNAGGLGGKTGLYMTDMKIRRLTPTECERLQGFPDGWTSEGLSSIMEICVSTGDVTGKQLLKLGSVSCTTSDGSDMEVQIYPSEKDQNVNIAVDGPLHESFVTDITNHGKDMVMLFSQKEILSIDEFIKKRDISGKTASQSTKLLWNVRLAENLEKEKLSTTLTLIREITKSLTYTYAKTGQNIIGVIIHLNESGLNSLKGTRLNLRMVNITPISDTQRYKCLGNAVTTNVVSWIGKQLIQIDSI